MFYLTTLSTYFIYIYVILCKDVVKDHSARQESCSCHYMGYSFQLAASVLLETSSYREDSTYHGLCSISRGALAGMRNSSNESIFWSVSYVVDQWCMPRLDAWSLEDRSRAVNHCVFDMSETEINVNKNEMQLLNINFLFSREFTL